MRWTILSSLFIALGGTVGCQPKATPARVAQLPLLVRKDGLAKPVQIQIILDGRPLNELIYPFLGDIDGDGTPDLLIGTRIKGRLLIYPDIRRATDNRLTTSQWFDDLEPTGRIPSG